MAIKLNTSYSKKLGLPGYSSHSFSASVEVELGDINQAGTECARLYGLLQASVDHEIRNTGFVPDAGYGMGDAPANSTGTNGTNGHAPDGDHWQCSDKQKDLILKLVDEHSLDRKDVDHLARERFGKGVLQLNKMEASGLIDELIDVHGGKPRRNNGRRSAYTGANGKGGRS
jgi:hypothetical protein